MNFRDASAVSAERRWLKTAANLGVEIDAREELEPFSYTMVAAAQVHRRYPRASVGTGSRLSHAEVLADGCSALSYLSGADAQAVVDAGVLPCVVELLR